MGSQSVTNFSDLKKKRIRDLIKDYSSSSPQKATRQAREIGAAAVGTLGQGPANEFLQALTSPRVEYAIDLIMSFADELKRAKNPERVYETYGVGPDTQQPLTKIISSLTQAHSESLSGKQAETELAFAARDAIPKTIIDVVSGAFPREKEAVEIDRKKFAEAFKRARREDIATAFMEHVAGSLISLVLDATRGSVRPEQMEEIKKRIRERFVPEFIEQIKKGE
jgi:hypothetical protein